MMMGSHANKTNGWLIHSQRNFAAALRLFCFPYAGGGASIFSGWSSYLPASIEVCPVQLPGRETRWTESSFTRLSTLVQTVAQALRPYLDKPFAFFGHSMGALISFELARYLRQYHGLSPARLIVSGHRAPQLPDAAPPFHTASDSDFLHELRRLNGTPPEVLEQAELRTLIMPLLRADFEVCETYVYQPDHPLDCPISAFGGLQDKDVSRAHLAAWREQTRGAFVLRMFPGDHFYLNTGRALLFRALAQELIGSYRERQFSILYQE